MIALALGCVGGLAGTWLARAIAWRYAIVARPNPIVPQHQRPVAYLGGIGIAVGAAIGLAVGGVAVSPAFALGAAAYTLLGALDDVRPLEPLGKLVAQTSVASVVAAISGAGAGEAALAAAWIVVVVNAVNLTDVCDGLVGSLALAALIAAAVATGDAAAPVLGAATLGFLWFNRPPATIFLGDAGSHLLGFAIAYAWLPAASWPRAAAAVLGAGVFLLELGFLVIVRWHRGLPFWRGSPDHLALRLQAAGLSKQRTIAAALALALPLDGLAVWLARDASTFAAALALALIACAIVAVTRLYALAPVPRLGRAREAHP